MEVTQFSAAIFSVEVSLDFTVCKSNMKTYNLININGFSPARPGVVAEKFFPRDHAPTSADQHIPHAHHKVPVNGRGVGVLRRVHPGLLQRGRQSLWDVGGVEGADPGDPPLTAPRRLVPPHMHLGVVEKGYELVEDLIRHGGMGGMGGIGRWMGGF